MELIELTALELGGAIKRGEVSVREAAEAALDAIAARNAQLYQDNELEALTNRIGSVLDKLKQE